MESPAEASGIVDTGPAQGLPAPVRAARRVENALGIIALAMMIVFPIWESLTRYVQNILFSLSHSFPSNEAMLLHWKDLVRHVSVTGSTEFVQHGSLLVGLLGAAIAARENRLLSLATATVLPHGWPRTAAKVFAAVVGGVVSVFLCIASIQFIASEYEGGHEIAYGIKSWMIVLCMPIGFGLIGLRILYHAGDKAKWIVIAMASAAIVVCFLIWVPDAASIDPKHLVLPLFALLVPATILGAPIFVVLAGAALILFWGDGSAISSLSIDHYSLVTNASLPTIPLFTLAGYFLAEGGASKRLVRVFLALFGSIRGGPAIVTALLCAFFTSFTGASGVTILALGGVLMPILLAARYSDRAALGLLTGAGSLGMLFPPCLPLVLYAIIAKQPIESIFLGSMIPGFVLVLLTAILGMWMGPKLGTGEDRPRFDRTEAMSALWEAKWELLIPVVAIVGLFAGFATPVEAAAYTAFYAFLTQTVIWRDLKFRKDVPHVLIECGLVIGGVLLILGVAQGFTNYLIFAGVPQSAIELLTSRVKSPYMFLLILNLFLLVVGGLMDVYPAIVVVAPLVVPIGEAFGINPIHLGVVFLANLEMGFLMPPLGINLLLSSYRFKKPIPQVYRAIIPLLIVQFIGVLLITYVPPLTTFLPALFGK